MLKPQIKLLHLCRIHHLRGSINNCPKLCDGLNRQIKAFQLVGRATWSSSLIPTAATLLSWLLLRASAFMCHAVKSMTLIFGNNGGLYPQRQTHFSHTHTMNPCFIFKFIRLIHSALNVCSGRGVTGPFLSFLYTRLLSKLLTKKGLCEDWHVTQQAMCYSSPLPGLREARTLFILAVTEPLHLFSFILEIVQFRRLCRHSKCFVCHL